LTCTSKATPGIVCCLLFLNRMPGYGANLLFCG
jgi:hypothetical protein